MNYDKKTIRDIDVSGKKILLRCDFNVPHDKATGVIHDDTRIVSTLPTIRYLLDHNAAVILLSHMGRPHGEWKKELSLFSARDHLEELLEMPVPLTEDVLGPDTKAKCAALQPGQVVLVENLRFRLEEEKNDPEFAKELASLADIFVFDAFGAAHRAHASTEGVSHYLPSVAGLLVEKELEFMGKALDDPKRPLVAILGGSKVSDKIGVINNLLQKADTILIGGGMAYTFQAALGRDIGGRNIIGNIEKLPHVLIAGTTGSGKSVCTNSLIVSLLYKSTPEEVRFIMVDPKMVELAPYNGIPHLLIPVVTDPKKAAGALQWAVYEMMKRYKLFSENGVKDLAGFNALAGRSQELKKMPTVVVVIDELADLMLVAAKEVEESICRVAQMGRAAGMHLVIATQRPSSDVITGLMKANIPSRIAFAVASSLESRIILDTTGAEKLVGKGDMLYAPLGAGKPTRVQGCFITPEEIERVVDYVKQSGEAEYSQDVMDKIEQAVKEKEKGGGKSAGAPEPAGESPDDELLTAAVDVVLETGQASVSMLQRRLKLGYARAARLVDQMEERGYVGPFEGSKPRQLLIDKAKWQELKMAKAPAPEPEIDRNGSIRDVFESRDALD